MRKLPYISAEILLLLTEAKIFSASRSGPRNCLGLPNWTGQDRYGPDFSPSP